MIRYWPVVARRNMCLGSTYYLPDTAIPYCEHRRRLSAVKGLFFLIIRVLQTEGEVKRGGFEA